MIDGEVRWPRIQEILAGIMNRWETSKGRKGLPGIHGYYWETPVELASDSSMGTKFIEPGIPGKETALVISLREGFGSIPKMPMGGPFVKEDEIQEIERWIDTGMPE
ncbi:MAG: hypothetical protein O2821_00290 [Chloroflexi bacterium]|nr:hypothetical protein [Chloroflexota bacterium]MDA1226745.1 hypothetical protein [Chloroflexota bacterium]